LQLNTDPRHIKRQELLQILFQWDFRHYETNNQSAKKIIEKIDTIDSQIQKQATLWKINDMAKIDVAILRLATWELMFENTPKKTVIDEAIELAKEFGNEKSSNFVSGVLGRIYDSEIQK
jgi:transcription antitermination protein NusB